MLRFAAGSAGPQPAQPRSTARAEFDLSLAPQRV